MDTESAEHAALVPDDAWRCRVVAWSHARPLDGVKTLDYGPRLSPSRLFLRWKT